MKEKIKIVHIVQDLGMGGLEQVIAELVRAADKNRFDVKVWCLVKGGRIFDQLREEKYDVQIMGFKSFRNIRFLLELSSKLKKESIRIVHTHGLSGTVIGRLAGIFAGVPVVLAHVHSTYWELSFKQRFKDYILGLFTKKIICCSKAIADFLVNKEKINRAKLQVIYNGIDLKKYADLPPRKTLNEQTAVIGCVASFFPHKGHQYLISAAEKVIKNFKKKAIFIFAGEGQLRGELEQQAKDLKIEAQVIFKGLVEDIPKFLSEVDLLVLASSEREGLGISLIEAMAAAKPVVGSNLGGIPEVIENGVNGILVEPKDSHALAQAIVKLIEDRQMSEQMGLKGREIAAKKFSFEKMLRSIEDLYIKLYEKKD